jgi:hypothetical protein
VAVGLDPDKAGFADAQRRLREAFGEPCTFRWPAVDTWPDGTPIDPLTERPYDPSIEPASEVQRTETVTCSVVFRAVGRMQPEPVSSAIGVLDANKIVLIADITDRNRIEGATEVDVRGERYVVDSTRPDGIGEMQRFLAYIRDEG